ncbi:3-oxoacyl-[acyl- carrier-protein] reductase [Scheffersomyces stipitis CBS 6054]|uniref:3-oxoacyl-[acyl-carrier-protein] reductase n=1 Tax=Scheffersomyces stipitis (strain ATCC 58785 / CBS 6054 / NBRC 10063 / NRRL Y-11545) TaxID=322104 RepID=A3LXS2_PICST|nr:3-oxoacyl-[acyl- carrier-protein] reductase [Scheffersomyces stipitis CBS 6054]ABN67516.2 3-oxoacyl-[acyl- carrier-protein] reductase [Scheffersomyces stipitis CBS 6054]KAG2732171.1 hypothetical protein G9P44_004588 [Scheffersomyces stipitis]
MYRFRGHKAVITGGSKGLGKAISQKLASQGCSVVLLARSRDLLEQNVKELPKVTDSQQHSYLLVDLQSLSRESPSSKIYSQLANCFENTSILVNCAGITTRNLLSKSTSEEINTVIDLNLIAPIILSKLAYKPMLKKSRKLSRDTTEEINSPTILNISSVLSMTNISIPGTSIYAASKAGLLGFTRSLAAELGGRVRVNALMPGLIPDTEMGAATDLADKIQTVAMSAVVDQAVSIIGDNTLNGKCLLCDSTVQEM